MNFSDQYSQDISEFYWNYEDDYYSTYHKIKAAIENISEDITPAYFRERLEPVREELLCSARRFLLDYVKGLSAPLDEESYRVSFQGKTYDFHGSGMQYSVTMPDQEREDCIELLTDIAMENNDPEGDYLARRKWRSLMRKAMLWTGKKNDTFPGLLSRDEALRICHGLGFDYQQAEAFLVRTQEDDGFIFTRSEDLIEAFCFFHRESNNWHNAEELKDEYFRLAEKIPKQTMSERPENYTRSLYENLPGRIAEWEQNADIPTEELFLKWMVSQADKLDVPGKSAYKNYRNLALLAWELISDQEWAEQIPAEELQDYILDYCREDHDLPEGQTWYTIMDTVFSYSVNNFDNADIKNPKEYWKSFRYLSLDTRGNVAVKTIGNRAIELLEGEVPVTKADLLVLLWLVCDLSWSILTDADYTTRFYNHISDFWVLSEDLLEDSMLPAFYAPHLLERSMLLSICAFDDYDNLSRHGDYEKPFEIYEKMCEGLTFRRAARKKSKEVSGQKNKQTKLTRKMWEQETRESFENGRCSWQGLESLLAGYFDDRSMEKGTEILFATDGISLPPDPNLIITYPDPEIGELFDAGREGYSDEPSKEHRFKYLYSLYLYLREQRLKKKEKIKCRCNYVSKCSLTVVS